MNLAVTANVATTTTLKRTEHDLIVRIGKSEAKVSNNKTLRSIVMLKLTTDIHEASHGLSATAELLVKLEPLFIVFNVFVFL